MATANFFGTKFIGANYGWVFYAYGLDGILSPMMGGIVRDQTGNFLYAMDVSSGNTLRPADFRL